MKTISRFFIFNLILAHVLIAGCAKQPSVPHIGGFIEVYGAPHIVHNNVCYFMGPWGPGASVLKINYKDLGKPDSPRHFYTGEPYHEQVISIESEYIEEDKLHFYIPLLIESMKDTTQGGTGAHAYAYLYSILRMEMPDGYGDYYMHPTKDGFTGTPFVRDKYMRIPKFDETTYDKVIQWWNTELHEFYKIAE